MQVLPCPAADRPHLVASGNISGEYLRRLLLQNAALHSVGDIYVKFRMVCENERHMYPVAQGAGKQRGGYRAVAVDDIKAPLFERIHQLRRERQPRAVAHELRHVDARIAQHRKIEHGVVRVGIKRRHDRGIAEPVLDYLRVICDGIRHAVYGRWERIVYEADVELVHTRLLSGEIVLKLYPNQAQMQAKNQGLNFFLIVS